jgi:hypothetical protein
MIGLGCRYAAIQEESAAMGLKQAFQGPAPQALSTSWHAASVAKCIRRLRIAFNICNSSRMHSGTFQTRKISFEQKSTTSMTYMKFIPISQSKENTFLYT